MQKAWLDDVVIDVTVPKGAAPIDKVLIEIQNRVMIGKSKLPRSFVRRCCNRHDLSTKELMIYLRDNNLIEGDNYPYKVLMTKPIFKAYDSWMACGWHVRKEAVSYAVDFNGMSLFSDRQVKCKF